MKLYRFFRLCFLIPILLSNIHFLSKRVVYECIESVEVSIFHTYLNKNSNLYFLKEFYIMNFVIIYNFEELIYKLKKEFHYYVFSTIFEKLEFFFYDLFFYKKECNETFIKYLYFIFWTLIEIGHLFQFSPCVNLFSLSHHRYRLVFFTIIACFCFTTTTR